MTLSWINWELCCAIMLLKNLITHVKMFKGNQLMMKNTEDLKNENTSACKYKPKPYSLRERCAEMKQTASPTRRKCLIKHLYMHIIQTCKAIFPQWFCFCFFHRNSLEQGCCHHEQGLFIHTEQNFTLHYLNNMNIKRSETIQKSTQMELFLGQCGCRCYYYY